MSKKLILALILVASFPAPRARGAGAKTLIVLTNYYSQPVFYVGLLRAVLLKKAGMEVSLAFEQSAVLCFLSLHGELAKPSWQEKLKALAQERSKLPEANVANRKYTLLKPDSLALGAEVRGFLGQVKSLGIPYLVSAQSAMDFGVYEELKAAGEPLSPDPHAPADISALIKQGYRVMVY